ncbi:hypothetical protein MSAN_00399700 [Mycena sanguinolenta]|uniref:Uncharacterized protein n=1 Tax=Mycena sanguinolenta TaxID=230812 RepID=A0A8H7DJZ9_9AGAR|nr:hypothetical protein MSAN_00399700 [Mycena sanguinolenta]
MFSLLVFFFTSLIFPFAAAHVAAWHKGMYCLNGTTPGFDDQNANTIANPLFNLKKDQWWFHAVDKCDQFPPDQGDFLELPANGEFTVELAVNRAFTTLSYGGRYLDGQNYTGGLGGLDCITSPNIHTQNQSMASGSAFAISYNSDLSDVTPENLVVFTTLYHTPWERIATYAVPNLPACPAGGCICAVTTFSGTILVAHEPDYFSKWGWVPNGCGEPNIYMQGMSGFRCNVTGQPGDAALATAVPPTWCQDSPANCTTGARQMIYWNQAEGNNIEVSAYDESGSPKSPAYNSVLGFDEGAQHDIFLTSSGYSGVPNGAQAVRLTLPWSTGLVSLLLIAALRAGVTF